MFPDSETAKRYSSSNTKTAAILNNALEPESSRNLFQHIKTEKRPYSIMVDESNDIMCEKECAILARFFDEEKERVSVGFIDMPICNSANAENVFRCINTSLEEKGLKWSNCVGFSSDNCNVMIGKTNSVLSRVKQQAPYIYSAGCPSHLINICAKTAAKELTLSPESLLIDIYYYFEKSAKRREELEKFQDFCDVAQERVQKHCPTRWRSLGKGLNHLIKQRPAFLSYFQSMSQNQQSRDIQARLEDPLMKVYMCFLHIVTQIFDTFNLIFHNKSPVLYKIQSSVNELLQDIGSRLVKAEELRKLESITDLAICDGDMQYPDDKLFIGYLARNVLGVRKDRICQLTELSSFIEMCGFSTQRAS